MSDYTDEAQYEIYLENLQFERAWRERQEQQMQAYNTIPNPNGVPVKAWSNGVQFEESAVKQLLEVASLPFVTPHVAAMPDTHWGNGATVGSVIPTQGAIIPAAVGVDIGCGMYAVQTNARRENFKDDSLLLEIFRRISNAVPHGRTANGGPGDRGAWGTVPEDIESDFNLFFAEKYKELTDKHPGAISRNAVKQLGTLGTGNHFIEVSVDTLDRIWIVIHSGSRGLGNRIGSYFTQVAKRKCEAEGKVLPNAELAYLVEGDPNYADYISGLTLAQSFAWKNRQIMMERVLGKLSLVAQDIVHCHHNYMSIEEHFGQKVNLTRKGAVRAQIGDLAIIPGSMGARTYIARGLGNPDSFCSCSHGAGRAMGRKAAKKAITLEQHIAATEGVVCWKGEEVIDESPSAYKNIESVMAAQADLVEPVVSMKQLVCVKGLS